MDKNQTIGIVLMSVLFVGYMWISDFNKPQEIEKPKTEQQTVIPQENKEKPNKGVADQKIDSSKTIEETNLVNFEEKKIIITTQDVEITFSNNGGKIEALKLLNHTDQNDKLVQLFDDQTASLSLSLNTVKGDLNGEEYFESWSKIYQI